MTEEPRWDCLDREQVYDRSNREVFSIHFPGHHLGQIYWWSRSQKHSLLTVFFLMFSVSFTKLQENNCRGLWALSSFALFSSYSMVELPVLVTWTCQPTTWNLVWKSSLTDLYYMQQHISALHTDNFGLFFSANNMKWKGCINEMKIVHTGLCS